MLRFTLLAALPLLMLLAGPVLADDVHSGKVISVGESAITIQDMDGENETFTVADDCKITHGGKPATLKDIDNGDFAKIKVQQVKGKLVAVAIDAKCEK